MDTSDNITALHIMALLPENYDRSRIPGFVDVVDGFKVGCGIVVKSTSKKKSGVEETVSKRSGKKMTIDCYFGRDDYTKPSSREVPDVTDGISNISTPWKLSVLHTGTKNVHWHFIYVSTHKNFRNNSRLGKDISNVQNKIKKVGCMLCLYNYLYSGNGRKVITDNLDESSKHLICCTKHKMLDDIDCNGIPELDLKENSNITNQSLIQLILDNRAFTDSHARVILSCKPNGQNFLFQKYANDRLKVAIQTSKMIVFKETTLIRLERAKRHYEINSTDKDYALHVSKLQNWLKLNSIDEKEFAHVTYNHFMQKSGKKNNLFLKGPPSTGKSMVIESLISCHFNFTRLTGVNETSSFNFASLIHANACLMDEIKVTNHLFETWKLLAAGQTFTSDVKYHEKCEVSNCVLYTASNYEIDLFCTVPSARDAIDARTHTFDISQPCNEYFNIAPHSWEMFWNMHDCSL